MLAEEGDDLFGLAVAHQAGIDKDADQLVANRLMDQHGGNSRIHPAR